MAATIRLSQQHSCSFDHLVGAGEHRCGHVEAERLGSREIDHQLELDRGLNWKLARFRPLRIRSPYDAARRYSSTTLGPYEIKPPSSAKEQDQ